MGLLATNTSIPSNLVPFRAYALFPVLLHFKCILEVAFCDGFQHRLRFCLDHLSRVKMADLQSGNPRIAVGSQVRRAGKMEGDSLVLCG
jgi:hypothetical protein